MWNFITSKIGLVVLKYGAIAGAILAIILGIRQTGRYMERIDNLERSNKNLRNIHANEVKVHKSQNKLTTDAARRKRVRSKFDAGQPD